LRTSTGFVLCRRKAVPVNTLLRSSGGGGISPRVATMSASCWPLNQWPQPICGFTQTAEVLYSNPHAFTTSSASGNIADTVHMNSTASRAVISGTGFLNAAPSPAVRHGLQLGCDHGALALIQVPAMQVGGEYIAERIGADELLGLERNAYTVARAFAVAAIKDTMFQQGDGVAQTIRLDALAQGVELGAFHQREDLRVRVDRTNQWQTRAMTVFQCCCGNAAHHTTPRPCEGRQNADSAGLKCGLSSR
jgi:hypothetical protein